MSLRYACVIFTLKIIFRENTIQLIKKFIQYFLLAFFTINFTTILSPVVL